MAYDDDLANRIRELIAVERGVTEKKMFGGLAFMINGNMAVSASGQGGLLLHVEPAQTNELLQKPYAQPFERRGRVMDGWLRIEDSDLLVGIFWKKFGTPTQDAESGTEHEFQLAYEIWKKNGRPQIMMYFNEKPFRTTNTAEGNQMLLVVKFKENFPKEGLWWPYNGRQNFENLFRQHLTSFIRKFTSETTPVARGKGVQPEYDDPKWLDEEANRLDVENQRLRDETPPR